MPMSKLVVTLNPSAPENEKVFRDFLQAHGWGWWHWLANFWIVDTGSSSYSSQELSADLQRISQLFTILLQNCRPTQCGGRTVRTLKV
jgi:hypothetical protein